MYRVQNNVRQSAIFRTKIATNCSKTLMSGCRCRTRKLYFKSIKGKLQAAETNLCKCIHVANYIVTRVHLTRCVIILYSTHSLSSTLFYKRMQLL